MHHREAAKSCGIRQDDQMKSRRRFLMALGGTLAWPRFALAQQAERTYRVGWLSLQPRTEPYNMAFEQRLRDLGFAEGRNLVIEFRTAQGRIERLPELAADLARQNCDVLLPRSSRRAGTHPSSWWRSITIPWPPAISLAWCARVAGLPA